MRATTIRRRHPIALLLPLLLATAACSAAAPAGNDAAALTFIDMDSLTVENGQGRYTANRDGAITTIDFPLPLDRVAPERFHFMEKVDETDAGVVLILDRYASRAGADGRCKEGFEIFARAFSLEARSQLMAELVESCLGGIDPVDPPVTWLGDGRFRIEGRQPRSYAIEGSDTIRRID